MAPPEFTKVIVLSVIDETINAPLFPEFLAPKIWMVSESLASKLVPFNAGIVTVVDVVDPGIPLIDKVSPEA